MLQKACRFDRTHWVFLFSLNSDNSRSFRLWNFPVILPSCPSFKGFSCRTSWRVTIVRTPRTLRAQRRRTDSDGARELPTNDACTANVALPSLSYHTCFDTYSPVSTSHFHFPHHTLPYCSMSACVRLMLLAAMYKSFLYSACSVSIHLASVLETRRSHPSDLAFPLPAVSHIALAPIRSDVPALPPIRLSSLPSPPSRLRPPFGSTHLKSHSPLHDEAEARAGTHGVGIRGPPWFTERAPYVSSFSSHGRSRDSKRTAVIMRIACIDRLSRCAAP
ncbi:hypothetical protein BC834DRAFT_500822 [Gloeopeniophorella convolvens]|nr:hypothetical protein BC834DRAFT_500822 [Gloeopeniophorella convolvens]